MDQPLAPVDFFADDFADDSDFGAVEGRAPGVQPAGVGRYGASAASEMPDPLIIPTDTRPAYGLVGVPDQAVTTRDVKVFATGLSLGVLVATFLSWFGRSSRP